ncbi:General stress protein 69 [Pseudobythopirellula maris]|uniref:General stress protein 69 n=1 Tax=Pseudobythopirellula maris TaxID=2527991 RepID=A0A5C5ZU72_9BACT|nr:aldo/keto reductase [Pseudobythopirellula maris]TWT90568.1 General stress protein 69 [Pseudobythopirellula maris]
MSALPPIELRALGGSGLEITSVALGCWPIAGVTTLGTNEADSLATVREALDQGVNHLDTAFAYGANGESERIISKAIVGRRDEVVLATKGGVRHDGEAFHSDASAANLRAQCEESLRRLGTDHVELLYLHGPDGVTPLEETAAGLAELKQEGKTRAIGVSNLALDQIEAFHAVCPIDAVQLPYNMLQRDIERRTLPWCVEHGVAVAAYWPLMKGLLAGKLKGDDPLDERDSRRNYPMYQGEEWAKNQAFLDKLREVAAHADMTVAQLVVAWTAQRPGITTVLCGAKRPEQIRETAAALRLRLTDEQLRLIDQAIADRGDAAAKRVFE